MKGGMYFFPQLGTEVVWHKIAERKRWAGRTPQEGPYV